MKEIKKDTKPYQLKVEDLKEIIQSRHIEGKKQEDIEFRRWAKKYRKKCYIISLAVGISLCAIGFIAKEISNAKEESEKEEQNKQTKVNEMITSFDFDDFDFVYSTTGVGNYLEEMTGYNIDEKKLKWLNEWDELRYIKLVIDQGVGILDDKGIDKNTILKKGLKEAKKYMENVIFHDNKDLLESNYKITFQSLDGEAYLSADTTYQVSDDFLKECINSYTLLNRRDISLEDYVDEYEKLTDGLLKMAFFEVSLESGIFENKVEMKESPKTMKKIPPKEYRLF